MVSPGGRSQAVKVTQVHWRPLLVKQAGQRGLQGRPDHGPRTALDDEGSARLTFDGAAIRRREG